MQNDLEMFAETHAEQWRGCVTCKKSHHETSFCRECGACFFEALAGDAFCEDSHLGIIVHCQCGSSELWD